MTKLTRRTPVVAVTALLVAALLSGCSRHTAFTVRADLVPFLGSGASHVTVPYSSGTVTLYLPPNSSSPQAGALIDLTSLGVPSSATSVVDGLALDLAATVTPTTDIGAGGATLYIADASASDVFQAPYQVATFPTPALAAGQQGTVTGSLTLDAHLYPDALTRLQSGSFRIGVAVQGSASSSGQVDLTLDRLQVSISLPPGFGLP